MGGNLQVLSQKTPDEGRIETFDFISQLPPGSTSTVIGGVVGCGVWTGVDPNPAAVVVGGPTFNGTALNQYIAGGVAGTVYKLRVSANMSDGQTLTKTAYLAVIEDPL